MKLKPYWIYGIHACTALFENPNRNTIKILKTKDCPVNIPNNLSFKITSKQEIESVLPPSAVHQGIAVLTNALPSVNISDITEGAVVILDQVVDPHNIGAILRTATAFGIKAVIIPQNNSASENGLIAKVSCGGLEKVPLIAVPNIVRSIEILKKNGYWIYGLTGNTKKSIYQINFSSKTAFVLGAEGSGIRRLVAQNCDEIVKIPMTPNMESLNVSNAGAIAMSIYFNQLSK